LCSLAVTIISGQIMGKTNTGRANTAIVVLGAVAAALTTLLKLRDYDGKASRNAEAVKFYTQGQNTASGFLSSYLLTPRLPDVLVDT